jgi:prevent-host-death family protein
LIFYTEYSTLFSTKNLKEKQGEAMTHILLDQDIKPLSEFRANAASFIQQVHDTGRPLVITQHGKSAAVLLDVAAYEAIIEKLELLEDIQIAESQVKEGNVISHDELKKELKARSKK